MNRQKVHGLGGISSTYWLLNCIMFDTYCNAGHLAISRRGFCLPFCVVNEIEHQFTLNLKLCAEALSKNCEFLNSNGGSRIRTYDLKLMRLARCHFSIPRQCFVTVYRRRESKMVHAFPKLLEKTCVGLLRSRPDPVHKLSPAFPPPDFSIIRKLSQK
jgi:hypothetical protein